MKERPIIFKGEMVRPILSLPPKKTMTRRTNGLEDVNKNPDAWWEVILGELDYMAKKSAKGKYGATFISHSGAIEPKTTSVCPQVCPYGMPGDQLWVRENCVFHRKFDDRRPSEIPIGERVFYPADNSFKNGVITVGEAGKTRPSIFMPRWVSRIQLENTSVRAERLNDISEEDAKAEGISYMANLYADYSHKGGFYAHDTAKASFKSLFESINGPGSFDDKWVWVIDFKRVER